MQTVFKEIKHKDYFDQHYPEAKSFMRYGLFGQVVNFLTEAVVFYGMSLPMCKYVFPDNYQALSLGIAIFFAAILEGVIRLSANGFNRSLLVPGSWKRGDVEVSIFNTILLICGMYLGVTTSIDGSRQAAQNLIPQAKQQTTADQDDKRAKHKRELFTTYSSDSLAIANRYAELIAATKSKRFANVSKNNSSISMYRKKEANELVSYQSKIGYFQRLNKSELVKEKTAISELKASKSKELSEIQKLRSDQFSKIENLYSSDVAVVASLNTKAREYRDSLALKSGNGLAFMTVFLNAFLLFASYRWEKVKYKGGVTVTVNIGQYEFEDNILSSALSIFSRKIGGWFRQKLYNFGKDTEDFKPAQFPTKPLYSFAETEQKHVQVNDQSATSFSSSDPTVATIQETPATDKIDTYKSTDKEPVPVEIIKEVIVEVPVEKIVEKIVYRDRIKEVPVEVIKRVQVIKEVEVIKEVPVEIIKEVSVKDKRLSTVDATVHTGKRICQAPKCRVDLDEIKKRSDASCCSTKCRQAFHNSKKKKKKKKRISVDSLSVEINA